MADDNVNAIFEKAAELLASDIHVDPMEDGLLVRFRVDGTLRPHDTRLPLALLPSIKSHRSDNMRMAVHGDSVCIRLHRGPTGLDSLGLGPEELIRFKNMLRASHGIVFVNGRGTTTTLYAALRFLNSAERKLVTVEAPVECTIPGVLQGVDSLRTCLNHDPDVIMLDRIADRDTAQLALDAARFRLLLAGGDSRTFLTPGEWSAVWLGTLTRDRFGRFELALGDLRPQAEPVPEPVPAAPRPVPVTVLSPEPQARPPRAEPVRRRLREHAVDELHGWQVWNPLESLRL